MTKTEVFQKDHPRPVQELSNEARHETLPGPRMTRTEAFLIAVNLLFIVCVVYAVLYFLL